jgi:hypothetical protein
MMSIQVEKEQSELKSRSKKLQRWCMPAAAKAAAGISHGTRHNILSEDLNMSHVPPHSVPCVLTQDQCDGRTGKSPSSPRKKKL